MTRLRFSDHSQKEHGDEEWNASQIVFGLIKGTLKVAWFVVGKTADIVVCKIGGGLVGLIMGKPNDDGERVVITGFRNDDPDYWNQ